MQRIFGVSDSTLRLWRQKGLPHVGGGGIRPRYPLADVLAWMRRRTSSVGSGMAAPALSGDLQLANAEELQRDAAPAPESAVPA